MDAITSLLGDYDISELLEMLMGIFDMIMSLIG